MRKLLPLAVLLSATLAWGQGSSYTGVTAVKGAGNIQRVIPNAPMVVCGYPATGGTPCTNYATTYTSPTLTVSCSLNPLTQVVSPASVVCIGTSDNQGNFEIFAGAGNYSYYFQSNNTWNGPYVITLGGSTGGGCLSGCVTQVNAGTGISITGTPNAVPVVNIATNPTIPGNPTILSRSWTGIQGTTAVFQTAGTVSGSGSACFDNNGNITNVGCPPVTALASGSAAEDQFRNSVTGALASDSTHFFNPTTHTDTVQNETITGTLSVQSNYAQTMTIPLSPCTVSSFNPPLTLGLSGLCINNDGFVAESVNGAAPIDIPLTGSNSVVLKPSVQQSVIQAQATPGTGPTLPLDSNNLNNWRVVTASWNWLQTDVAGSIGNLAGAGSGKTLNLLPCPLGIDTNSAANNYVYKVYIAGTGTPEAALVTGGTCTSGLAAGGTIVVTTANAHSAGFTVGSASTGIQEAWNDAWINDTGAAPVANSQSAPFVKLEADTNYNVYASIYLRGRGGILDGAGAYLICATRDRCIYVGTTGGSPVVNYHRIWNLNGGTSVSQDGAQVSSVSIVNGSPSTYTVTTATAHGFAVGDAVDCEYYSQKIQQHWVATAIAPTSGTTLTVQFGTQASLTPSTNTYGFCNIFNAFIEDNSDHVDIKAVNIFTSVSATGTFSYGIVNDNDQQLQIDHLSNRSTHIIQNTANYPIGAMVYERYDQNNNGITYLHNSELTNVNCGTAGGNGFVVDNTVCQAFPLYGFRYFGALQPFTGTNIYEDVSTDNPLYHAIYSQAVPGPMGYLVSGGRQANLLGSFPALSNQVVQFPCTAGGGAERDYWVIPHVTAGLNPGPGSPLFIGFATGCNGGNIVVSWPSVQLEDSGGNSVGTLTWDVLMTTGAAQAPSGTGSFYIATGISGSCSHAGMCQFTDTQAAPSSGTIAAQLFDPLFWFWPAGIAINWGTTMHVNQADTNASVVASFGTSIASLVADSCSSNGNAARRTPVWITCTSAGGSSGQPAIAQVVDQVDSSSNGNVVANSKGRLNLGRPFSNVPADLITLSDSNFLKTLSTSGMRPLNDAGDMALGIDQSGGYSVRSATSISAYINSLNDNSSFKERLTSALKTFTLPVTITGGSSTLTVAGNTTLNGTANTIAGGTTMNGALGINASLTAAGAFNYAAGGGTAQAQTVTLAPAVGSLVTGLKVNWLPLNANTGAAPTLAVNGLTAKPITKNGTAALVANDLTTTAIAEAFYDGTEFQLLNPQTNFTGAITWPLSFSSGGTNLSASAQAFLGVANLATAGNEVNAQWPVARSGTVTGLSCLTNNAVAAGSYVVVLDDNAAGTNLTCTITSSNRACNDFAVGHAAIVAANDKLDISVTGSGPATTATMSCSLLFQ